jgi:hypothetical protein
MFDDAREICMCLRDSVTQTPVLGSVEYDLKSLCDGTWAIRLGQSRSIQQHVESAREALDDIRWRRRFGRARGA